MPSEPPKEMLWDIEVVTRACEAFRAAASRGYDSFRTQAHPISDPPATNDALLPFAHHRRDCAASMYRMSASVRECDCGLAEAIAALNTRPTAPSPNDAAMTEMAGLAARIAELEAALESIWSFSIGWGPTDPATIMGQSALTALKGTTNA